MNSRQFKPYRHSGKFGIHGPLLAILMSVAVSLPLGIIYSYLIKWIPFIYLNFVGTALYGGAVGLITLACAKFGKVRNTPVAFATGVVAGTIGIYFAWSGHVHALLDEPPLIASPQIILALMAQLYEQGSWGFSHSGNITGLLLAMVWLGEAAIIVVIAAGLPGSIIDETPFSEKDRCWLDSEKRIDTIQPFTDLDQIAVLKTGDLSPLAQAKPRDLQSVSFARLTLRSADGSDDFCTVRIDNITITADKEGKSSESVQALVPDLVVPRSMFDLIMKFERFAAASASGQSKAGEGIKQDFEPQAA